MVQYHEVSKVESCYCFGPEELKGGRGYRNAERVWIWGEAVNRSHGPRTSDTTTHRNSAVRETGHQILCPVLSLFLVSFLCYPWTESIQNPQGINADHAGQPPRDRAQMGPRKHLALHAVTVSAVGTDRKAWRDDDQVYSDPFREIQ